MGIALVFIILFFAGGLLLLIYAKKYTNWVFDITIGFIEGLPKTISSKLVELSTETGKGWYIWLCRIMGVSFIAASLWMLYWIVIMGYEQ